MVITADENMPISQLIGYMLKVIKSEKDILSQHDTSFKAIRHGDYDCFFDLIKAPQHSPIVQWKLGVIKTDNFSQNGGDTDFAMLHIIEESIKAFFYDCYKHYGDWLDTDISDLTYCKCGAFEIAMRVQKNKERQNRSLSYDSKKLEETINEICAYNNIPNSERELLHNGRKFVNMVKHHKPHTSWKDGIIAFETAWEVCNKYQLKLCY